MQPDGFISGMTSVGPWVALNRTRSLSATSTLYVVRFRESLTLDQKAAWCLSLVATYSHAQAIEHSRHYADGLVKLEPTDLASIRLEVPGSPEGSRGAYRQAIATLLAGKPDEARAFADAWLDAASRKRGADVRVHRR